METGRDKLRARGSRLLDQYAVYWRPRGSKRGLRWGRSKRQQGIEFAQMLDLHRQADQCLYPSSDFRDFNIFCTGSLPKRWGRFEKRQIVMHYADL